MYRMLLGGLAAAVCGAAAVFAATGGEDGNSARASTTEWTPATSGPLARSEIGAARIGRYVYTVGGLLLDPRAVSDRMLRYDLEGDSWSEVAPLPIPIHHPAVTSYDGKLYVHGGYKDLERTASARLYEYDPATDAWTRLPNSSRSRAAHTIEALDGKLYAVGGRRPDDPPLRGMEVYNLATQRWHKGPSMSVAREHLTGVELDGRIFVIAGRSLGHNFKAFERYRPGVGWTRLPDLRTARGGIASAVANGLIVVFGGETQGDRRETIEEVEAYDRARHRWIALPDMLTPRHGLGGASYNGRVFALEGGPMRGKSASSTVEYLDVAG